MRKHDRCIPIGNIRNPCGDIFLLPMRKTAYIKRCIRVRCVCVCLSMYTVSRHPSPDSTPNEEAALSIQSGSISPKCLSWSKPPPLTDATFYFAHAFYSVHPSLSLFLISPSLSLCRPCIRAQRRAGRSTARHRTQMGNVSAPSWLQHRTCVIETHVADSSVN